MTDAPARITRDTLRGAKVFSAHLRVGGGGSGCMQTWPDYSQLSVFQGRDGVRVSIDGKRVRDLDAALAVLNGELTLEEAMPQPQAPRKVSLDQQIDEIDYELKQRASVYPRIASSHPSRKSELEYHVTRMEAVRASLLFLREHEPTIREAIAAKKAAGPDRTLAQPPMENAV